MKREPVVAGQFYPGNPKALEGQVHEYLGAAEGDAAQARAVPTLLAMVPHAGYVYSGPVAGLTMGRVGLADSVLLLGPNHTGLGAGLSLWDGDAWRLPGDDVAIDEELREALLANEPRLIPDKMAHLREHSLEVVLPFVRALNPKARINALSVSERDRDKLLSLAKGMAKAIRDHGKPVSLIVSSDMSHYIPHEEAGRRDKLALDRILALDPEGLLKVVRDNSISMCGVLPMTLGLALSKELGASKAEVVAYATSGDVSGDYSQVVGYAGVLVTA